MIKWALKGDPSKRERPTKPWQLELPFPIVIESVLTKKGLQMLGGPDKLCFTKMVLDDWDNWDKYYEPRMAR